jgi:hypothetical protein
MDCASGTYGYPIYVDQDRAIEYANLNLAANLTNIPLRIGLGWIMSKTTTENSYDLKCLFVN